MPASSTAEALSDADWEFLTQAPEGRSLYFECALVIRTKSGRVEPFVENAAQRYVNAELDRMLAEVGYVRALVLKGRQMGISTAIGGRNYRDTTNNQGIRTLVITHKSDATKALFEMTQRFHEHCPRELRPETSADNANELDFKKLDAGYRVATAGGVGIGRGFTYQRVHGSEYGFWPNAEENLAGIFEAMPSEPETMIGTECVLESTANKPGDAFHRQWKAAKAGKSIFRAIFVPWFVHEEYAQAPPEGWAPNEVFAAYMARHGLTIAQTYWAWAKNREMAVLRGLDPEAFCPAFQREYPATDEEAFEAAGDDLTRVFPRAWVMAAVGRWKANADKPREPMIAKGVDVAQGGLDETIDTSLRGRRFTIEGVIPGALSTDGPAVAAGVMRTTRDKPTTAVDTTGGWGGDALTQLKQWGQDAVGVNSGAGSDYKVTSKVVGEDGRERVEVLFGMRNMRAELHWRFHEALNPESGEDLEIPDDPKLIEELLAPTFEITASGLQIEAKDDLQAADRLGRSPDRLDSLLLCWHAARIHRQKQAAAARKKPPPPPFGPAGGTFFGS